MKVLHKSKSLTFYAPDTDSSLDILHISTKIKAGFPSPAADFSENKLDLTKKLIKNPSTTFMATVEGNSMIDANIHDGDLLIIDKSLEPVDGKIAVCYIDGEFTIKRIKIDKDCCWLVPANSDFKPIKVTAENDFLIWGIVTNIIKSV